MKMPFDVKTAQRLKEKGYITDAHLSKLSEMHGKIAKAQKMADGGMVQAGGQDQSDSIDVSQTPEQAKPEQASIWDGVPDYSADPGNSMPSASSNAAQSPEIGGASVTAPGSGQPAIQPMQDMSQFGVSTAALPSDIKLASDGQNLVQPGNGYNPMSEYGAGMQNAFNMQQEGVATQLKAAEMRGAEQAAQYTNASKKIQEAEDARKDYVDKQTAFMSDRLSQLGKQIDDYSTKKIDPGRYWANKSTGDKVLAGIGMFLGSFGTANSNLVVDQMHKAVQRDLDAQAMDLQTQGNALKGKQSLYGDMFNLFKNKEAAMAASQVAIMQKAQLELQSIASRYSGPEAKGKAQELYGQIEAQKQQANMQLQQSMQKMYAMQNPEQFKEFLDKDQRERMVPGYKGFATQAPIAKDIIDASAMNNDAQSHIDALKKFAETPGASVDPQIRAQARVHMNALQGHLAKGTFGRVSEGELDLVKDMIADPTKLWSLKGTTLKSLDTLRNSSQESVDSKALAAGLVPYGKVNQLRTMETMPPPMSGSITKTSAQRK